MALLCKKNQLKFLTIAFFIFLVVNGTAAAVVDTYTPITPTTRYVGAAGGGNYTTIQAAINSSSSGDTIIVYPGTYTENVNVNKQNLVIRSYSGNPDDTIVIRSNLQSHNFKISANDVIIRGFKITGAGSTGIFMSGVSGVNIINNKLSGVGCGIQMESSSRCNLINNTVSDSAEYGFYLFSSSNCNMVNNIISDTDSDGIYLYYSSSCNLTGNTISNANCGISLDYSSECVLRNNTASSGRSGICLLDIENCTLTGNIMSGNRYNFDSDIYDISDFDNAPGNIIDTSNLVDGKAVYYLEGEPNPSIGRDAGVIYCINCGEVEIKDFVLQNNSYAVFLCNTSSEMQNNTINNTEFGITVFSSQDVRLSNSRIENSLAGIVFEEDTNITLTDNTVRNSIYGIVTFDSENCTLTGNYIQNATYEYSYYNSVNSKLVKGEENTLIRENRPDKLEPRAVQKRREHGDLF